MTTRTHDEMDPTTPTCEPPAKRVKYDIQQSENYWFRLGDVILIADQRIAFKIHSDLLARKSKVFNDLINHDLPRPQEEETLEGCPVVHLTDDPQDFSLFLSLVYDGWEFRKDDENPQWDIVKVMLLLGDKYDVPEFRDEAIRRLNLAFPMDIETWDKFCGIKITGNDETVSVAQVTRTLDMPDLHAALLYSCLSLPITDLMHGVEGNKDLILAPEDLARCLEVREVMPTLWLEYHNKVFSEHPPANDCLARHKCRLLYGNAQTVALDHACKHISPPVAYDPLDMGSWDDLLSQVEEMGMCMRCMTFFERRLLDIRQEFRNSLAERFRLKTAIVS